MKKLFEEFQKTHDARIDQLTLLASDCSCEVESDTLEEFRSDNAGKDVRDILDLKISDVSYLDECLENRDPEEFFILLHDNEKYGFLAKVLFPVLKYTSERSCSFNQGSCYVDWFYGDTIEELVEKVVASSTARADKAKAKFLDGSKEKES